MRHDANRYDCRELAGAFGDLGAFVTGDITVTGHGAGGMAAPVRAPKRTGGGLVMLGGLILAIGSLFGDHAGARLGVVPRWLLGVLLACAGLERAAGASPIAGEREISTW